MSQPTVRVPVVDLRPPDADDVSVAAVTDLATVAAADMTRKVLSGLIYEYERVA
jgi:hypothetical protein